MTDTPIVDAAIKASCANDAMSAVISTVVKAALRAALPGDLPTYEVYDRAMALMRELYPEQFR